MKLIICVSGLLFLSACEDDCQALATCSAGDQQVTKEQCEQSPSCYHNQICSSEAWCIPGERDM